MYLIYVGWVKNCLTSILAFNIAQFFLSLNYQLLSSILNKVGFDLRVSHFFGNYLVGRKTRYFWNNFSSPYFNINVSIKQDSALSPILSALYLSLIFHVFEKRLKILKIPVSVLSFVDNSLFIAQSKSLHILNSNIFCSYYIMSLLLDLFSLVIEYRKTEVFHFSRLHSIFNPPPLDLFLLEGPVLWPKENWKYLGFIFNRKLSFHQYVNFYINKAIFTIKSMKMLENSSRSLISSQKCLLDRLCVLPITLYGSLL